MGNACFFLCPNNCLSIQLFTNGDVSLSGPSCFPISQHPGTLSPPRATYWNIYSQPAGGLWILSSRSLSFGSHPLALIGCAVSSLTVTGQGQESVLLFRTNYPGRGHLGGSGPNPGVLGSSLMSGSLLLPLSVPPPAHGLVSNKENLKTNYPCFLCKRLLSAGVSRHPSDRSFLIASNYRVSSLQPSFPHCANLLHMIRRG